MYVILVYDIVMDDQGKKILPKIYKTCKKYLTHIQNSVFEGELKESQVKRLELELKKFIRKNEDSVIIFWSDSSKWMNKEYWGRSDDATSFFI